MVISVVSSAPSAAANQAGASSSLPRRWAQRYPAVHHSVVGHSASLRCSHTLSFTGASSPTKKNSPLSPYKKWSNVPARNSTGTPTRICRSAFPKTIAFMRLAPLLKLLLRSYTFPAVKPRIRCRAGDDSQNFAAGVLFL